MHRKVDSHVHDEYDRDIKKLKHNNRKMLADIKIIKEENTTLMQEIFQARKQVAEEKKLQAQMIREFERPRVAELERQTTTYPEE
jgi:mRNA-degrading endonuclease RelE of RelBE toxin-antitoxin system